METLLIHRDLLRTPLFDQIIDMLRVEQVRQVSRIHTSLSAFLVGTAKPVGLDQGHLPYRVRPSRSNIFEHLLCTKFCAKYTEMSET